MMKMLHTKVDLSIKIREIISGLDLSNITKSGLIYHITSNLWMEGEVSYDEMRILYSICHYFGYSSLDTSKLVRSIVIGNHNNIPRDLIINEIENIKSDRYKLVS